MRPTLTCFFGSLLASAASADTIVVQQIGLTFEPRDITIEIGDTVRWVWTGGFHTVTEGTDGTIDGDEAFNEFLGNQVLEYSVTFDAALLAAFPRPNSRYDYFCEPHFFVNQRGSVTVDTSVPAPYCTAKASSAGCAAKVGTSAPAQPVSGAGGYAVTASGAQSFKSGLLFAGLAGPSNIPFSGGSLCVAPPNKRGPLVNSGGSAPEFCDGAFSTTVNDGVLIPFGLDAGAGNSGWYQWWYRDPQNGSGTFGTALSDAIQLDFQ